MVNDGEPLVAGQIKIFFTFSSNVLFEPLFTLISAEHYCLKFEVEHCTSVSSDPYESGRSNTFDRHLTFMTYLLLRPHNYLTAVSTICDL